MLMYLLPLQYEVNGDGLSGLETPSVLGVCFGYCVRCVVSDTFGVQGDSVEDEDDEDVDEEYQRAMNAVTYQCLKLAIHPEQPEVHLGFFLYRPIAPLVVVCVLCWIVCFKRRSRVAHSKHVGTRGRRHSQGHALSSCCSQQGFGVFSQ
jgi:hypothetical protein